MPGQGGAVGELAAAARRSQLISPLSISLRCERTFSQRCIHQCILRSPRRAHSSRCIHNQAGPGCYSSARRSTYRMIKACAGMRARLEDSAKGWCYLATAQHSDRVDLQVYRDAWHSELLSTEDNVHIRSFSPSTVESALMTKVASPRSIRNIGAVRNSRYGQGLFGCIQCFRVRRRPAGLP